MTHTSIPEGALDLSGPSAEPPAHQVLEGLPHGIAVLDHTGRVLNANHRWYECEDPLFAGGVGLDLLHSWRSADSEHLALGEHLADGLERVLLGRAPLFELQYEIPGTDPTRWSLVTVGRLPEGAVVSVTDTTAHQTVREVLTDLAFHDPLTGLPNRSLVVDRIRMALIRSARNGTVPAVIFIDLDGFKAVNDRFGHDVGDHVLVEAGHRLSDAVRDGDTCGRWGGDEFVLVIDLADPEAATRLVERTREAFTNPFSVDDHQVSLGLSVGVAVAQPGGGVADLVRRADAAMYRAKRSGTGVEISTT